MYALPLFLACFCDQNGVSQTDIKRLRQWKHYFCTARRIFAFADQYPARPDSG